jgi:hypothetical protein
MSGVDARQENFMNDLQALLNQHNAEIMVTDDRKPYGQQSGQCLISFNYEPGVQYLEFNLPTFMSPE